MNDLQNGFQEMLLQMEQKDWLSAEKSTRQMIETYPDYLDAIAPFLAKSLYHQGNLTEALAFALPVAQMNAKDFLSNQISGFILSVLKKHTEAIPFLRKAYAIERNALLKKTLIQTLVAAFNIEQAAKEFAAICQALGETSTLFIAPLYSVREYAAMHKIPLQEAGEIEQIPFKDPRVFGKETINEVSFYPSNKPYVAELNNVRILGGRSNFIFTQEGCALDDHGRHPTFGHFVAYPDDQEWLAKEDDKVLLDFAASVYQTREIAAGILMAGFATPDFGHWLPDYLSKLRFLQQHPDFYQLPIIVNAEMPPSHFEHLARLSGNSLPLIRLHKNESLLCKRLLAASPPVFLPLAFFPLERFPAGIPTRTMPYFSEQTVQFLRGTLKPKEDAKDRHKRLFFSRKNMKSTRLVNEEEIISALTPIGFEVIYPELLSASQQIALFQQADCVVVPRGSALNNVLFAHPLIKVIALSQEKLFNWGFFQGPMEALGYQNILLVTGKIEGKETHKHASYRIPVEELLAALLALGIA